LLTTDATVLLLSMGFELVAGVAEAAGRALDGIFAPAGAQESAAAD
jgi:hypothetical protein